MGLTRMLIFIGLVLYLLIAPFIISQIANTYHADFGMGEKEYKIKSERFGSLITGLTVLSLWQNLLFFGIPFILIVILGLTFFLPTTNAGG